MNWSDKQRDYFWRLREQSRPPCPWREVASVCFGEDVDVPAPAKADDIQDAEKALGRALPGELKSLYLECDGILRWSTPIVMPLAQMLETNQSQLTRDSIRGLYMPFDHLLFFGEEGNGDLFAFPIVMAGTYGTENIYKWDHENDSRTWKAGSVRELLARLAVDWMD
jgi:hypothetical protein